MPSRPYTTSIVFVGFVVVDLLLLLLLLLFITPIFSNAAPTNHCDGNTFFSFFGLSFGNNSPLVLKSDISQCTAPGKRGPFSNSLRPFLIPL